MRKLFTALVVAALVAGPAPVAAQSREDQQAAREEMRAGRRMPLRDIERRIIPQMKGHEYLGFEDFNDTTAYRLKFLKDGQVTWVDVDARTGRVLRVSR
jgi:uncharacterized membrane protein YkoI